jgi:hypothetical protein
MDLEAGGVESSAEGVIEHEGAQVADVGIIVDGGATGIERYLAGFEGGYLLNLSTGVLCSFIE